jgi:hypothetical protein
VAVEKFLEDPHSKNAEGMRFYVINFLWIAAKERGSA